MVRGISHTARVIPSIGTAITASQSGKMSLPVSSGAYIYSQFRHVAGVPAPEGSRGVPVSRLKVLDVLIEQLVQIKKKPADAGTESMSDRQIDALIGQYESRIRAAQAANAAMPYKPAPAAPAAALFSIAV